MESRIDARFMRELHIVCLGDDSAHRRNRKKFSTLLQLFGSRDAVEGRRLLVVAEPCDAERDDEPCDDEAQ